MSESLLYFTLAVGVAIGAIGAHVAERRGRSRPFGFIMGFFFGILGILVIYQLPNKKKDTEN